MALFKNKKEQNKDGATSISELTKRLQDLKKETDERLKEAENEETKNRIKQMALKKRNEIAAEKEKIDAQVNKNAKNVAETIAKNKEEQEEVNQKMNRFLNNGKETSNSNNINPTVTKADVTKREVYVDPSNNNVVAVSDVAQNGSENMQSEITGLTNEVPTSDFSQYALSEDNVLTDEKLAEKQDSLNNENEKWNDEFNAYDENMGVIKKLNNEEKTTNEYEDLVDAAKTKAGEDEAARKRALLEATSGEPEVEATNITDTKGTTKENSVEKGVGIVGQNVEQNVTTEEDFIDVEIIPENDAANKLAINNLVPDPEKKEVGTVMKYSIDPVIKENSINVYNERTADFLRNRNKNEVQYVGGQERIIDASGVVNNKYVATEGAVIEGEIIPENADADQLAKDWEAAIRSKNRRDKIRFNKDWKAAIEENEQYDAEKAAADETVKSVNNGGDGGTSGDGGNGTGEVENKKIIFKDNENDLFAKHVRPIFASKDALDKNVYFAGLQSEKDADAEFVRFNNELAKALSANKGNLNISATALLADFCDGYAKNQDEEKTIARDAINNSPIISKTFTDATKGLTLAKLSKILNNEVKGDEFKNVLKSVITLVGNGRETCKQIAKNKEEHNAKALAGDLFDKIANNENNAAAENVMPLYDNDKKINPEIKDALIQSKKVELKLKDNEKLSEKQIKDIEKKVANLQSKFLISNDESNASRQIMIQNGKIKVSIAGNGNDVDNKETAAVVTGELKEAHFVDFENMFKTKRNPEMVSQSNSKLAAKGGLDEEFDYDKFKAQFEVFNKVKVKESIKRFTKKELENQKLSKSSISSDTIIINQNESKIDKAVGMVYKLSQQNAMLNVKSADITHIAALKATQMQFMLCAGGVSPEARYEIVNALRDQAEMAIASLDDKKLNDPDTLIAIHKLSTKMLTNNLKQASIRISEVPTMLARNGYIVDTLAVGEQSRANILVDELFTLPIVNVMEMETAEETDEAKLSDNDKLIKDLQNELITEGMLSNETIKKSELNDFKTTGVKTEGYIPFGEGDTFKNAYKNMQDRPMPEDPETVAYYKRIALECIESLNDRKVPGTYSEKALAFVAWCAEKEIVKLDATQEAKLTKVLGVELAILPNTLSAGDSNTATEKIEKTIDNGATSKTELVDEVSKTDQEDLIALSAKAVQMDEEITNIEKNTAVVEKSVKELLEQDINTLTDEDIKRIKEYQEKVEALKGIAERLQDLSKYNYTSDEIKQMTDFYQKNSNLLDVENTVENNEIEVTAETKGVAVPPLAGETNINKQKNVKKGNIPGL